MEIIHTVYFVQFFINIPLMFAIVVGQHLRLELHRYTFEQLLFLGYFIIIYIGGNITHSYNIYEIVD